MVEYDWSGARVDLERALALNPGDATSHRRRGVLLADLGQLEDAIAAVRRAAELDPLATPNWNELAELYIATGQLALARSALLRARETAPEAEVTVRLMSLVTLLEGRPAAALDEFARCNLEPDRLWGTALAEHSLGNARASQLALEKLIAGYAHVDSFSIARVYAWRGERDRAFAWLERAYRQHEDGVDGLKTQRLLFGIRGDPRYAALLGRMKLPLD